MGERVGEVIESSSTEFIAQAYELHSPPPLGSLVKVKDGQGEILAVVSGAETSSIQPGRRPIARGRDDDSEEELHANNPHLEKLLLTTFNGLILGHTFDGQDMDGVNGARVSHHLPPYPPKIHAFVHSCDVDEVATFSRQTDYLNLLVNSSTATRDELIMACLSSLSSSHKQPRDYLVRVGKELSLLLAGEPQRLNAILKGIRV